RLLSASFAVALLAWSCVTACSASAQVFYEPVRYQYGSGAETFYYGGHNPRVLDFAALDIRRQSYSSLVTSEPIVPRTRVYSDSIPFRNLADDSYTSYVSY